MRSSHTYVDSPENLSVKYENIYAINGKLKYLTTDKTVNLLPVNKWLTVYKWCPEVLHFDSDVDIFNYVNDFENKQTIEVALMNDNIYYGNIGHALWDGFYPAYLAAIKFGYECEDMRYVTTDFGNKNTLAYEIMKNFFGVNEAINYQSLDVKKLIHFKTLISGNGTASNLVMTPSYTLYGKSYEGMKKFKKRMYNRFKVECDKSLGKKAVIIHNKRYSPDEIKIIHKVVEHFKSSIDIKFIDWRNYSSFKDQLNELQDVDIHISGPGTGMMYMPFLKNGAVNINLGYMEKTQTNTARPNIFIKDCKYADYIFPGWMEQSVCAGADYVSTLYYDRYNYNSLEFEPLVRLIEQSINLINNKIVSENNLNTDAQIFVEYCKVSGHSEKICAHLTNIAFFMEMFVAEHPAAIAPPFVDVNLLRSIKEKYSYTKYCY